MAAAGLKRDTYNGAVPQISTIAAGHRFFRISPWSNAYLPNAFNPTHRPLDDLTAGRFDPIEVKHEGYLYLAKSVTGAVGEGVLRNRVIGRDGFMPRRVLSGLAFTELELAQDIEVAELTGAQLRRLNLSGSLTGCDPEHYKWTRTTADQIFRSNPSIHGLNYSCRNNPDEEAVLVRGRNGMDDNSFSIMRTGKILDTPDYLELVSDELAKYRIYVAKPSVT